MVTLYTTHCPKCKILEKKLKEKKIKYQEIADVDTMIAMGFRSAPYLQVDEATMDFAEANKWLNEQE